jgi:hypothetical protein
LLARSAPLPLSLFGEEEAEDVLHAAALPPALEPALLGDSPGLQQPCPVQQQQPLSSAPEQPDAVQPTPDAAPSWMPSEAAALQPNRDLLSTATGDPADEAARAEASQEPGAVPAEAVAAPPLQEQPAEAVVASGPPPEQPSGSGIDWDSVGFSFASDEAEAPGDATPVAELHMPEADAVTAEQDAAGDCSPQEASAASVEDDEPPAEAADSPGARHEADSDGWEYGDYTAAAEDQSLPHAAPEDEPAGAWGWSPAVDEALPPAGSWQDGWDAPAIESQPAALSADVSSSLSGWDFAAEPAVPQPAASAEWGFGESRAGAEVAAQPSQEADVWGVLAALESPAEGAPGRPQEAQPPLWEDAAAAYPACPAALPPLSSEWGGDRWQAWHLLMQVRAIPLPHATHDCFSA